MSWFKNLKSGRKSKGQNLTDIIRGLQWAVNSAIHATENQYIATLSRFFEKDEEDIYPL